MLDMSSYAISFPLDPCSHVATHSTHPVPHTKDDVHGADQDRYRDHYSALCPLACCKR